MNWYLLANQIIGQCPPGLKQITIDSMGLVCANMTGEMCDKLKEKVYTEISSFYILLFSMLYKCLIEANISLA